MSSSQLQPILVVEDEEDIRFVISSILSDEGYAVREAQHGLAALESIARAGMPKLILLDMLMPVMDGWQFAAEVRAKYDNVAPIVVMTAAADAKERANAIGAVAWIAKPFAMGDLLVLIKKHTT